MASHLKRNFHSGRMMLIGIPFFVLIALSTSVGSLASSEEADKNAPILPRAKESLLLDITRAGDKIVAVGERGHILVSTDDGDNWQQMQVPTRQMLTAVYFINAKVGWVVGHDGLILKTLDGGSSWDVERDGLVRQTHLNAEAVEHSREKLSQLKEQLAAATDAAQVEDLEYQIEEAQMDHEDALLTFKEPVFTSPLFDVWFQSPLVGWAVGAYGLVLHTSDGGITWESASERVPNPDEMHLNAIVGNEQGNLLWIVGESGLVLHSSDAGMSWNKQVLPYDGSFFGAVSDESAATVVVFGLRGNILKTSDKGLTWTMQDVDSDLTLFGGSAVDNRIVIVGSSGAFIDGHMAEGVFRVNHRSNRLTMSAVIELNKNHYITAGKNGIQHVRFENKMSMSH